MNPRTDIPEESAMSATCSDDVPDASHPHDAPHADENTSSPSQDARTQPRLWTATFVSLIAVTFFAFLTAQGLNSGTPAYVTVTGGTAAYAGLLTAVFSVASIAARLVSGPLVDRTKRCYAMVAGFATLVVGCGILMHEPSDGLLIAARVLQGFGFSLSAVSASTAAADVLPVERLGEGIAYHGLGQALAMAVGPAAALGIVATTPPTNLFVYCSIIAAAGFVISLFVRYERHPETLPATSAYRRRRELAAAKAEKSTEDAETPQTAEQAKLFPDGFSVGRLLYVLFEPRALHGALPLFFITPAFGFVITFMGLYGLTLGIENSAIFFTLTAVSMILVRVLSKCYMDRIGPFAIFACACACGLLAFALLIAATEFPLLYYPAGLIYGVFLGVSMPAAQSVVIKCSPADRWGAANSLNLLLLDLGFGFGAVAWGTVIDAAGYQAAMACVMALIAIAIIVARITFPKEL